MHRGIGRRELEQARVHILTPQFYWIKKVELGIPDRKVLRIAPSLFEGLGDVEGLHYRLLRQGGERYVIAYSPRQIIDFFASMDLRPPEAVWFAQKELEGLEDECVRLTPEAGLVRVEGIWHWLRLGEQQRCRSAEEVLATLRPGRFRAPLRTSRDRAAHALLSKLLVASLIAAAGIGVAVYDAKKRVDELVSKRQTALKNLGLPATSLQLKSIYASLQKRAEDGRELAGLLAELERGVWEPGSVRRVRVEKQRAAVTLSKKPHDALLASLRRRFGSVEVRQEDGAYVVEVAP